MTTVLIALRAAEASDLPALAALEALCFGADGWDVDSLRAELTGPGRQVRVAVGGADEVVGYADVQVRGALADLMRIATAPAARRTGVATVLLDDVLTRARSAGADRMLLEVSDANPGAVAFYTARRFTPINVRPRYYRDGSAALVLQRDLEPAGEQP